MKIRKKNLIWTLEKTVEVIGVLIAILPLFKIRKKTITNKKKGND